MKTVKVPNVVDVEAKGTDSIVHLAKSLIRDLLLQKPEKEILLIAALIALNLAATTENQGLYELSKSLKSKNNK